MNYIIHSHNYIDFNIISKQLQKTQQYIQYNNSVLIPYLCRDIYHDKQIIQGNFIFPMWNVFERSILSKKTEFNFSYILGSNYNFQYQPENLKPYHLIGKKHVYVNSVLIGPVLLRPNSLLLFEVDKDIADPLINNKLL